jgi:hypothetical protein
VNRFESVHQLVKIVIFANVAVGSRTASPVNKVLFAVNGKDQYPAGEILRTQTLDDIKPVGRRNININHHQVGMALLQFFQCIPPVIAGTDHLMPVGRGHDFYRQL